MAFDKQPDGWLPGILQLDSDGSGEITGAAASKKYLLLEIDSGGDFEEITTAEANPTTGDIRKIVFGLMKGLELAWGDNDSPAQWVFSSSSGASGSSLQRTYVCTFNTTVSAEEINDES